LLVVFSRKSFLHPSVFSESVPLAGTVLAK